MQLIIDTYENGDTTPVLTHVFHGRTAADIQQIVKAHMQTDSFFKASMTTKRFQGMLLNNKQRWVK